MRRGLRVFRSLPCQPSTASTLFYTDSVSNQNSWNLGSDLTLQFPQPSLRWQIALALSSVYIIWGSTYLAIRFAIETIPPFLMAGARFLTSGFLLYSFMRIKGVPRPKAVHWKSAAIVGFFLILVANGGVSWAERKVPSGIAALLVG